MSKRISLIDKIVETDAAHLKVVGWTLMMAIHPMSVRHRNGSIATGTGAEAVILHARRKAMSSTAKLQEAMDEEFARWTQVEGLPEDIGALEMLSGGTELRHDQREWLDAWVTLYPGPM